jgi:tRNA1(Val) A37 N6-methylase TrmN6
LPLNCAMPEGPAHFTDDALLDGRVRLLQPRRGHRAGSDAVLLAAAVEPLAGETVADLGAGSGAVGLIIGMRRQVTIVFVERDTVLAEMCRRNIERNGLQERAHVIEADLLAPARERRRLGLLPASAEVVVTNPPFLETARSRSSPDLNRAAAHHLPDGGIERWLRACADLVKPKGRLALIHRADRLSDCIRHLERSFGGLVVKPIHPRADEPAVRIVITAVKHSRAPLALAPPLVLHEADGRFTREAEAIHRGEAFLHMQTGAPKGARAT